MVSNCGKKIATGFVLLHFGNYLQGTKSDKRTIDSCYFRHTLQFCNAVLGSLICMCYRIEGCLQKVFKRLQKQQISFNYKETSALFGQWHWALFKKYNKHMYT